MNTLNLHKLIKGILVHNGYFFVADIMKHYDVSEEGDIVQTTDIKSDPKLDSEQLEALRAELVRMHAVYNELMSSNPFDFTGLQDLGKRRYISLMKELQYIPEGSTDNQDEPEDNFLDIIFGIGEVTELCGLNATGKS